MNLDIVKQAMKENRLQATHVDWLVSQIEQSRDMERNYSHQLGEMARLSEIVGRWFYGTDEITAPPAVVSALDEITEYVSAVTTSDRSTKNKWVMRIIGPDDVIPCVGEFDALRKANQHNKSFAKLMANDPSPNDPYCVALAELAAKEEP